MYKRVMNILDTLIYVCFALVSVIVLYFYVINIIIEARVLGFVLISGFVVYINSMDILDIMFNACFVFVSTFVVCLLSFMVYDYELFERLNSDRNEKNLSHDDINTVKAVFISSLFIVHIMMLYVNLIVYLDIQKMNFVFICITVLTGLFCSIFIGINFNLVTNKCQTNQNNWTDYVIFIIVLLIGLLFLYRDKNTTRLLKFT